MSFFVNKRRDYLITTNFKVMYSSLWNQPELEFIMNHIALTLLIRRRISRRPIENYFFVRNPYDRILSFFYDKFQTYPKLYLEGDFNWQKCQTIFFKELGIDESQPPSVVSDRLLNTSFSEFIEMLPKMYRHDLHLRPQSWSRYLRIKGVPVYKPLITHTLRVDTDEVIFLTEHLHLDMSIRKNATDHPDHSNVMTRKDYDTINRVYRADFEQFGYELK